MAEAAFITLLMLYLVVGAKIDQWITISLLGFTTETPLKFHESPRLYDLVRIIILVAAATTLFGVSFPWYLGAAALGISWFATTWIGQTLAFNKFRQVCQDLADTADSAEERTSALAEARKSNSELRDMATIMNKYGR
jgi:hypothetical protein